MNIARYRSACERTIAWEALLNIGQIGQLDRSDALFVWPVRDQP